jgi:cytoskeletal protein RodZ
MNRDEEVKLDLLDNAKVRGSLEERPVVAQPEPKAAPASRTRFKPTAKLKAWSKSISSKIPKKKNLVVAVSVAVIVVVAAISIGLIWWGLNGHRSVVIDKFETVASLGQAMQNVSVKTEFEEGKALAFRFDYDKAEVGTVVSFEIINKQTGETVRDGVVESLRANETVSQAGQRFVSVVSQANTSLPAGNYLIKLLANSDEIARREFKIK